MEMFQPVSILWIAPTSAIESYKKQAEGLQKNHPLGKRATFYFHEEESFSKTTFIEPQCCSIYFIDSIPEVIQQFCDQVLFHKSSRSVVLNSQKVEFGIFKNFVQRQHNLYFDDFEKVDSVFEKAMRFQMERTEKQKIRKEWTETRRDLEALNLDLEREVQKRTEHIEESNEEERAKLLKQRQLIKFMQDLATVGSVEDVLILIQNETKRFHFIGAPFIAVEEYPEKTKIHALSQRQVMLREIDTALFLEVGKKKPGTESLSQHLANLFGRPFGQQITYPLSLHLKGWLCFEVQKTHEKLIEFEEFISDRIQLMGIALDRLYYESALSLYSYRWAKTFEGVKDPILIVDSAYEIIKSNRRELGRETQASGKCYEVLFNVSVPCENCPQKGTFQKEGSLHVQINQQGRFYQIYSYPIWDAGAQRPEKFVNYYSDVTLERQLYMKMVQTEKMSTLGLLAGNIAHELNNPLTGIRSLVQMILTEETAGTALYCDLQEIEKAATRCQKIIKNLLEFSSPENHRIQKIEVNELVNSTLPLLKTSMRRHKIFVELAKENLWVEAEPHLLQQVVFNLVNNAVQAMKDPGILSIQTYQSHELIYIEVSDTGPGISQMNQEKLFQPFFTTKEEGAGTGLGLSFSKSVIERFGGKLSFHPHLPQGACFVIELPRSQL
jgi:two-component system NtrC family sensor kinase